jgi:CheY-like chemotaxis protein
MFVGVGVAPRNMKGRCMTRVLIAEDSRLEARQYQGWLEEEAYEVAIAENGAQALELVDAARPDIVLTDLQMPEMNGLELLDRLQFQYPDLPIILMTAHGSEALAVEALQRGAAAYVPKSKIKHDLVVTLEQVLGVVRADREFAGLLHCLQRNEFSFLLDNDPALIGALGDLIQQMLRALDFADAIQRVRIGMALEHALTNALLHGNLELNSEQLQADRQARVAGQPTLVEQRRSQAPFASRQINVEARMTREEARFSVRDAGPGFDTRIVPKAGDPAALHATEGRGLLLMKSFMDEVTFNDTGNEVTLAKRAPAK